MRLVYVLLLLLPATMIAGEQVRPRVSGALANKALQIPDEAVGKLAAEALPLAESCKQTVFGSDALAKAWKDLTKSDHVHITYPQSQTVVLDRGKKDSETRYAFSEMLIVLGKASLPQTILVRDGDRIVSFGKLDVNKSKLFRTVLLKAVEEP